MVGNRSPSVDDLPAERIPEPQRFAHEVLAVVAQVRDGELCVLAWQRAREPFAHTWALPGGRLGAAESADASITRHLAAKVDVASLSHLEQLETLAAPHRVPGERVLATAYLGVVASDVHCQLPPDTAWQRADVLPAMAFDHGLLVDSGVSRLRAKLSYTNLGFALAPPEFTISELRHLYEAALDHELDPTNLQRVLVRRGSIEPTGELAPSGRAGGRPATRYRFVTRELTVTDPFAALRPPRG